LSAGDLVDGVVEHARIDVAHGNDLDVLDLQQAEEVAFAVPAAADEPDAEGLLFGGGEVVAGREGQAGGAGGEGIAAGHGSGRAHG